MKSNMDLKRIFIFLAFAFGIAWITAMYIFFNGGLAASPEIIPGSGITLAFVLIATVYMFAPAIANVLTRVITREGWGNAYIRPYLKQGWKYWIMGWVLPPFLTLLGGLVFFLIYPRYFDLELTTLTQMMPENSPVNLPVQSIVIINFVQALLISPLINSFFTFGEEFGWRAYLLQKLLPAGKIKAMIKLGVIWGVWHAPVIAMGHNYGLEYTGVPWTGILAMTWFCMTVGILLSWIALEGGSVWPAVIGHASLNGMAGIAILFAKGNPSTLLGPMPTGIIGGAGFLIMAVFILLLIRKENNTDTSTTTENIMVIPE